MNFFQELQSGNLKSLLTRYSDIIFAIGIVSIVGMMIIPLPTFLLDILITINITISVTLLLVSIYITEPLKIGAFPTILLVATLYRLALNVSSTRLILLQADAGEVIRAFGEFVVAGNYVVGAIIFLILTLIQFIVIAKGSERVAEVAARFTLDAMPGKQMSIDAELRQGVMDINEARKKRWLLQREAQFYGAMDGAMKFVKGDAIAGMIITCINIIGGLFIGVFMNNMEAGEAIRVYGLLTIGDGLVSQIPALIVSTAAGIVVTRVASEEPDTHLAADIGSQVLAQPKVIAISSGLLILIALVPGLPTLPFLILGGIAGTTAYGLFKAQGRQKELEKPLLEPEKEKVLPQEEPTKSPLLLPVVIPITLEVSQDLDSFVRPDGEARKFLLEKIPQLREEIFYELGVQVPAIRIRNNPGLPKYNFLIRINEIPVTKASIEVDKIFCLIGPERLALLGIQTELNQPFENTQYGSWINIKDLKKVEEAGIKCLNSQEYILYSLGITLRKHAYEFVGIQEVQTMLDQLEREYPAVVKAVIPRPISPQLLTEILRRLVQEEVSIRNLKDILQTLAEHIHEEKDPVILTEYIRISLKRYLTYKYAGDSGDLSVYLLSPEIEETIKQGIKSTAKGTYLAIEPEVSKEIISAIQQQIGDTLSPDQRPIILTRMEIRRYIKRLIEDDMPQVSVLSYQELTPEIKIQPIGRIEI